MSGTLMAARGPRALLTCCPAISTAPMNVTAGHAEIRAPSSPYPAPYTYHLSGPHAIRGYVEALGGTVDVVARVGDWTVRVA